MRAEDVCLAVVLTTTRYRTVCQKSYAHKFGCLKVDSASCIGVAERGLPTVPDNIGPPSVPYMTRRTLLAISAGLAPPG